MLLVQAYVPTVTSLQGLYFVVGASSGECAHYLLLKSLYVVVGSGDVPTAICLPTESVCYFCYCLLR